MATNLAQQELLPGAQDIRVLRIYSKAYDPPPQVILVDIGLAIFEARFGILVKFQVLGFPFTSAKYHPYPYMFAC